MKVFWELVFFILVWNYMTNASAFKVAIDPNGEVNAEVSSDDMILIWEHSCLKHMEAGNLRRAREVKSVIDWQKTRDDNRGVIIESKWDYAEFTKKLEEAKIAKEKMGDKWACNPPPERFKLKTLHIGRYKTQSLPETFLANSRNKIDIEASAEAVDFCQKCRIDWEVIFPGQEKQPAQFQNLPQIKYFHDLLEAPQGNRGDSFRALITTTLFGEEGKLDEMQYEIKQNEQDQLRQEYVDMEKKNVPIRKDLIDTLSPLDWGVNFPMNQFNASKKVGSGHYQYILCKVMEKWDQLKKKVRLSLKINSGYRNPYKNATVHGSAQESQHIYGTAIDINLEDFDRNGTIDDQDRNLVVKAAKNFGGCIEPEDEVGRIHVDWRGVCPERW